MQTLKIEIPKGYEIDTFDQASGEIRFREKPKSAIERILTVADVLKDNGITEQQFNDSCKGLAPDEVAYRIVKLLVKSLNEGWTPDWSNHNEYKYYPWFEMLGSSGFRFIGYDYWYSASDVGSRLCFKTRALAEHAGKHFTDVYKQLMVI